MIHEVFVFDDLKGSTFSWKRKRPNPEPLLGQSGLLKYVFPSMQQDVVDKWQGVFGNKKEEDEGDEEIDENEDVGEQDDDEGEEDGGLVLA